MAIQVPLLSLFAIAFLSLNLGAEASQAELKTTEVNHDSIIQLGRPIQSNRFDPSQVIQLSWHPRVFLYGGFLSNEECDHLISLAKQKKENFVENGDNMQKLDRGKLPGSSDISINTEDDISASIEERILAWTFLPKENSEPFHVLHFGIEDANQKYDYYGMKSTGAINEPLAATLIIYLSNVTQGGQIVFPDSESENTQSEHNMLSDCSKGSPALRPTKGNAILFFNIHPNASPDKSSVHGRCPVLEGEMRCATKLFHLRSISRREVPSQSVGNGDCTDEDENCARWAALGECQKNPVFMVGSSDYYGTCRKSCNACNHMLLPQ